jgi:hypothetical protein
MEAIAEVPRNAKDDRAWRGFMLERCYAVHELLAAAKAL